jgi:hypothetical protein
VALWGENAVLSPFQWRLCSFYASIQVVVAVRAHGHIYPKRLWMNVFSLAGITLPEKVETLYFDHG